MLVFRSLFFPATRQRRRAVTCSEAESRHSAAGTSTPQTMTLFTPFSKTLAVLSKSRNHPAYIPYHLPETTVNRSATLSKLYRDLAPFDSEPVPFPARICTAAEHFHEQKLHPTTAEFAPSLSAFPVPKQHPGLAATG